MSARCSIRLQFFTLMLVLLHVFLLLFLLCSCAFYFCSLFLLYYLSIEKKIMVDDFYSEWLI